MQMTAGWSLGQAAPGRGRWAGRSRKILGMTSRKRVGGLGTESQTLPWDGL